MKRFRVKPIRSGDVILWGLQIDKGRDDTRTKFMSMGKDCGRMVDVGIRMSQNAGRRQRRTFSNEEKLAQDARPFYPEH